MDSLPIEIVHMIADNLNPESLLNFMISYRNLHEYITQNRIWYSEYKSRFLVTQTKEHWYGLYINLHRRDNFQLHGESIFESTSQQIIERENYVNGKLHGTSIKYFHGNIVSVIEYKYGKKWGKQLIYHKSGKLKEKTIFINDKKAKTIRYDLSGATVSRIKYYKYKKYNN